jgi:hypothetical protein
MSNKNDSYSEALAYLIPWLRKRVRAYPDGDWTSIEPYGFDLYYDLIKDKIFTSPVDPASQQVVKEKLFFMDAIWDLCTRGILRPGSSTYPLRLGALNQAQYTSSREFVLTTYGLQWLEDTSTNDAMPMEYGRFSELLGKHDSRFGEAYRLRSQEAVRCYQAHTFFACCAMCGAAAESILLALAIAKLGEKNTLSEYQRSGGRGRIRNALVGAARGDFQKRFDNFLELLNYWRDESAHGIAYSIGEEEAFSALLFLMRFARLGEDEWTLLTTSAQTSPSSTSAPPAVS